MAILKPELLLSHLLELSEAKARGDEELALKLLVLNMNPGIMHGFMTRISPHKKLLKSISAKLLGADVYFAGGISVVKNEVFQLDTGGYSLSDDGYVHSLDKKIAVHSLLGVMFGRLEDNRFTLRDL